MAPFPTTRPQLIARGYKFANTADCRGCQQPIEWWSTPGGKKLPLNPMPDDNSPVESHFVTCPFANKFRRR